MRLRFQKGDIVAIALVVVLAMGVAAGYMPVQSKTASYAEIYQQGQYLRRVSLAESQEFEITSKYTNTITVKDGKIAVTESDCPGEDCVKCGWSDSSGRSIVCLPNELEIRIVSEAAEDDVDYVVR